MFKFFKSKSKIEKLEHRYQRLTIKANALDKKDSDAAQRIRMEAQQLLHELVVLEKNEKAEFTLMSTDNVAL